MKIALWVAFLLVFQVLGCKRTEDEKGAHPSARDAKAAESVEAPAETATQKIAFDGDGKPIAPLSLAEPPEPTSEGTPLERQLLQRYEQVRAQGRGQYDLACAYANLRQSDAAFYWLQRAALEEMANPSWALQDSDLKALRRDPRWTLFYAFDVLAQVYHQKHAVDRQLLELPKKYVRGTRIPLIVGMRGLGSVPEDFASSWEGLADSMNVAFLSVSATQSQGPQSYEWKEDVAEDLARVEKAIAVVSDKFTATDGQIFLVGFSQGAQMALAIVASNPKRFGGAIAMSPGTRSDVKIVISGGQLLGRRFVIGFGEKEHPLTVSTAERDARDLRAAGAGIYSFEYPGVSQHNFAPDFGDVFPRWIAYLTKATPLE